MPYFIRDVKKKKSPRGAQLLTLTEQETWNPDFWHSPALRYSAAKSKDFSAQDLLQILQNVVRRCLHLLPVGSWIKSLTHSILSRHRPLDNEHYLKIAACLNPTHSPRSTRSGIFSLALETCFSQTWDAVRTECKMVENAPVFNVFSMHECIFWEVKSELKAWIIKYISLDLIFQIFFFKKKNY